jgi:hypothetical protein
MMSSSATLGKKSAMKGSWLIHPNGMAVQALNTSLALLRKANFRYVVVPPIAVKPISP